MGEVGGYEPDDGDDRNLYQRMIAAMHDVRYVQKQKGKDGELKFSIVTHDAVTALCREALMKHGVYAYPTIASREFSTFKAKQWKQGQEIEVEYAAVTVFIDMNFVNADNPGESFCVNSLGIGVDRIAQQDKCPGKAISYAVKVAYLKGLALETGDEMESDYEQSRGEEPAQKFDINPNPAPLPTPPIAPVVTNMNMSAPSAPSAAQLALQPVWKPKDAINQYLDNIAELYEHDIKQVRKIAKQYLKLNRPGLDLDTLDKAGVDDVNALLSKCFKEHHSQEPKGD